VARLPNGAAPGFVYLAGTCAGRPVGGGGRDLAEAAGRLAGEAAEALALAGSTGGGAPGVPAGLGVAAGADREQAARAALLELVERDAAAAWWLDGARPRAIDPGVVAAAAGGLAALRAGARSLRATALLALASPVEIPVAVAVSRRADGRGLAVGLKADPDPAAAATGALMELLQMEIALELAELRRARGAEAAADRGPLARAALDPDRFAAFDAGLPAPPGAPLPADFAGLAARVAARGHAASVAELGRPGGLVVVRVTAPGLRPMPGGGAARPGAPGSQAVLM
jgi:ribosomal protein S12 methylthiotransferase accessory factor